MKYLSRLLIIAIVAVSAGCVNEAYDLSKLGGEMSLFSTNGIEIPMNLNTGNLADLLKEYRFSGVTDMEPEETFTAQFMVKPLEAGETSRTIGLASKCEFAFYDIPSLFRSTESEIIFDDNSFFKLNVSNGWTGSMTMSFNIIDFATGNKVGEAVNIPVPSGNSGVKIPFATCGLKWIPGHLYLDDFKFTVTGGPADGEGQKVVLMQATCDIYPFVLAGSTMKLDIKFDNILKELSDGIGTVTEMVDITSIKLKGVSTCTVPALFQGVLTGDATGSFSFEGPGEGADVAFELKCPNGLGKILQASANIICKAKDDVDLSTIDQSVLSFIFKSLKFDEGVIINVDNL